MNKIMRIVLIILMAVLVNSQSALADGGGHRGGHGGGHGGGYGGGHGGGHTSFGVVIGPGWWGPGWWNPYPYYPYYPYSPYYPYYRQPPVVVEESPELYVQPAPKAKESQYWYFCPEPKGYYPDVKKCPQGWLKVVPSEKPPGEEE
jgi:hypothetical protein